MNFTQFVTFTIGLIAAAGNAGNRAEAIRLLRLLSDHAREKADELERTDAHFIKRSRPRR